MHEPPTPARSLRWNTLLAATAVAVTLSGVVAASGAAASPLPRSTGAALGSASAQNWADAKWGDATLDGNLPNVYGQKAAQQDPGSLFNVELATGARALWAKKDARNQQVTGQGVGVAVLDSGVNNTVPGLNASGKVTYGPDLSIEGNGPLADQDTYGHGTFMAGIIAGRAVSNPSSDLPTAPADVQLGVAPDAKLLAIKLATTDGATDVSEVIAGIDWVVEHPLLPDGTPIRVINLSYGTDSGQNYRVDPLAAAAENAWRHGIVVVASAGNEGNSAGQLTDPAYDPYVIAVGAADSSDRADGWTHDHTKPASFSNASSTRHPDLLAPGTSIVSLRQPGSYIDANHAEGLVPGDPTKKLFRGSGTSQAAAVVSGAVADLLQAYPALTPDQVKYALTDSADALNNTYSSASAGAGILNLRKAIDTAQHLSGTDPGAVQLRAAAVQSFPLSTGDGSLQAARGGSVLVDADGNDLSGEVDVLGNAWNPQAWRQASTNLTAWSGGQWMGATWTGTGYQNVTDGGLTSARWSSARWSSARWSDADWDSARWSSARWSSARWSSARWSSARWSGSDWKDGDWTSADW